MNTLRRYRDRDYVQTREGYFFCVVGSVHPEDRAIAYLKYVPDPAGKWGKMNERFKRVLRHYTTMDFLETLNFLKGHPEYLYNSSVMGIRMSAVPLSMVSVHLKPEEKMTQLIDTEKLDALQKKVVDLANLVSDESGVLIDYIGVTGSVLLDIHKDFSDIDLVIYGMRNSQIVKETLIRMVGEQNSPIHQFDKERAEKWCVEKTERFPLTSNEALAILKKKWGRGLFKGTMFSIHPVKLEDEVSENYGDRIFRSEGMVKIRATVLDASEAEFLPSVYKIEDVRVLNGSKVGDIYEVVSYEGLYGGIAEEGRDIVAYGKLERVIDKRFEMEYHRVLVGSTKARGSDYIKSVYL